MPAFEIVWHTHYYGLEAEHGAYEPRSGVLRVDAESIDTLQQAIDRHAAGEIGIDECLLFDIGSIKPYYGALPVEPIDRVREMLDPWTDMVATLEKHCE